MDKNEYNLKLEEIEKYADQGNYSEAALAADTIDWKRVRNSRTLCMVSEIYEADNRFEDSKALLLRAYRRSPVGRAILYRLVEVTIHLKQFDEAIEYYSEYVQAAPNDNSRYILKYKIYKGRGSSLEEQIDILKEYLDQEYSEKWAYELAKLYQQADRIQECLATCDDLVLWFHSGKYVTKALELKRRYAPLTPKQQEIYDHRFDVPEEESDETTLGQEKQIVETMEDTMAEEIMADAQKEIAQSLSEGVNIEEKNEEMEAVTEADPEETETLPDEPVKGAKASDEQLNTYNTRDLQTEMVKSMREIVANVGRRGEEPEEDELAADAIIEQSKADQINPQQPGDQGVWLQRPPKVEIPKQEPLGEAGKLSIDDILLSMGEKGNQIREAAARMSQGKTQATGVISAVEEAVMNMGVQPPEAQEEEAPSADAETTVDETPAATEQEDVDIATAKTRRISSDELAEIKASRNMEPVDLDSETAPPDQEAAEIETAQQEALQPETLEAAQQETMQPETLEAEAEQPEGSQPEAAARETAGGETYIPRLRIKDYQRGMFAGFVGIQNMEEQIASAILQAGQKGEDRTSRSGNILIFGSHGCGKTTIATGIAKAIAQDRGSQFVKMAKIYAADFNRKDIASTIAKIAGGTLIIEEAGDLEDTVVDQLTTAMEFRTDGLIIILEDEQKYIHDLLMRHPRFTMKFTAQIYIPVFTIDELVGFGQIYAADMDYVLSESASRALYDRIGKVSAQGDAVSITNVIELVNRAIAKSNKFFRRLSAGNKRYDENNCIILQEKDFK